MRQLILGYGLNGNRLAPILGVSAATAKKRLDNPELLTLGDLDRISRFAHIPYDEIRAAVSK